MQLWEWAAGGARVQFCAKVTALTLTSRDSHLWQNDFDNEERAADCSGDLQQRIQVRIRLFDLHRFTCRTERTVKKRKSTRLTATNCGAVTSISRKRHFWDLLRWPTSAAAYRRRRPGWERQTWRLPAAVRRAEATTKKRKKKWRRAGTKGKNEGWNKPLTGV